MLEKKQTPTANPFPICRPTKRLRRTPFPSVLVSMAQRPVTRSQKNHENQTLEKNRFTQIAEPNSSKHQISFKKVLIAESDFRARRILIQILGSARICDMAFNGDEAQLAIFTAFKESAPYDMILLDSKLPERDGNEVLRYTRELEKESDSTVETLIILTSFETEFSQTKRAFENGCSAFWSKPFDPKALASQLRILQTTNLE